MDRLRSPIPESETRSIADLRDVTTWSSYHQYRRLFEAAGQVLGGWAAVAAVGSHPFDTLRNPESIETLRALGSPGAAYEALRSMSDAFMPAAELTVETINANECRIGLRMRETQEKPA